MPLPLKDVRFTTRRADGEMLLYPRLLRDRAILPKVAIAIRYFESMLGRERRELEPETLVHFLGDHKLARCVTASLARSYRFRSPEIHEIVSRAALRRLTSLQVDSPKALRLRLYDRVNVETDGFLGLEARAPFFDAMETELKLRHGELDRLLTLDAEEHALLVRFGAEPRPLDVVAQHNFAVLETLLRHATEIELRGRGFEGAARRGAADLFAVHGVDARFDGVSLLLRGRQDSMGLWARHGRKITRSLIRLLEHDRDALVDGVARLAVRDRRLALRLTPEMLDVLAGAPAPSIGWDHDPAWGHAAVADALLAPRAASPGVVIRRAPEAQSWAAGVVVPDLLAAVDGDRALVAVVRSPAHGARLAPVAQAANTGEPFVFIGTASAVTPLRAVGALTLSLDAFALPAALSGMRSLLQTPGVATAA